MTIHAKLSASGSERWINCPGSVKAEQGYANTSSVHAHEGTCAHELGELALLNDVPCSAFIGKPLVDNPDWIVDEDMADYVQQYVDYCRALPGIKDYEKRVDYSDWVPEGFGTSDCISLDTATGTLYVADLKYGKGIRVDADNNTQGMLYGLGAYAEYSSIYDIERVVIVIVQPRLDHISEWSISTPDLLKWAEWVSQRAAMTLEPNAIRSPSDKACQWCKAKAQCSALRDFTKAILLSDFDSLEQPDTLSDTQLREALDAKKLIIGWLDAVESLIKDRLEQGDAFEGFKLVAGRSLRQWGDDKAAESVLAELLGDEAYERKLLSPTKAEKLLGKARAKDIAELITKPEGKPTLAPVDDKRPAVNITVDDFDALS